MKKPQVKDQKLKDIVDELWSNDTHPIGDGSMADAIRHERTTASPVGGVYHSKKGKDLIRRLEKWLGGKKSINDKQDKKIVREIIKDLKNALNT